MKTLPHPYHDLFDDYPELRPRGTRQAPVVVTVKRKRPPKDRETRRGDWNFYVLIAHPGRSSQIRLDCRTARPDVARDYLALLKRTIQPDDVRIDDNAREIL